MRPGRMHSMVSSGASSGRYIRLALKYPNVRYYHISLTIVLQVNIAAMPATSTRRIISREVHSREVCRASHIQEHTHTCSNEKQL